MPALTLPATFANSFWSQDYRRGIERLYNKLEQGVAEDDEIVAFIRARANSENALANALLVAAQSSGAKGKGFNADEGASLLMAFRGLQAESAAQGEAHRTVAKELKELVADPFAEWAAGHKDRVYGSRNAVIDGWLKSYEMAQGEVDKLKHQYLAKIRRADEAEDDAKFAPNNELDNYTSSPRLLPRDRGIPVPQRTASVSERIAQRFKELQRKAVNGTSSKGSDGHSVTESVSTVVFDDKSVTSEPDGHVESPQSASTVTEKPLPALDKGKGKEVQVDVDTTLMSPPPMSQALPPPKINARSVSPMPPPPPPPILLAGLALPPAAVSDLLKRAAAEMNLRPIKVPIMGEYKDCFSGEEFVVWLVDSVQGFGGSLDRAEDAAKDLTERDGVLRRIGEFGNAFENNDEAYYQFRPKAFNLEAEYAKHEQHDSLNSPIAIGNLSPMADNLVKRSNTFVNIVSKAITDQRLGHAESLHVRARADANAADAAYRAAVRKLDRQRLGLEERLEETLKTLQKWETDRLRAVKTVLLQYQGTLANLPGALQSSVDRSSALVASYQPEADLRALIERYRTGPFRPVAHVYESLTHEEADVYFGIDLRRWAEGGWDSLRSDAPPKDSIPEVLTALLDALNAFYPKLSSDVEKRKTWIYEVPISAVHHLRESLNSVSPGQAFPPELIAKYDAPIIASTVKLWALELDPPLGTWEGWDDFRRLYPSVGSSPEETNEQQHIQDLQAALLRLPRIHLLVLEAIFGHLNNLIKTTTTDEANEIYMTKLALSIGRNILRPKVENEISIQDRHPTLLFIDLLKHFDAVLPPTIARKKRDSDRKIPLRKRTRPVDMRMSRSRLSVTNIDTREILEEQMIARNPSMRPSRPSSRASSPNPGNKRSFGGQGHGQTPSVSGEPTLSVPNVEPVAPPLPEPTTETEVVIPVPDPEPVPAPKPKATAVDPDAPPPMPKFKEPPPERDDITPPPMPKFVDPPPETDDSPAPDPPATATMPSDNVPVSVAPPTPTRTPPVSSTSAAAAAARSRSPSSSGKGSPISPTERFTAASGGANLARSGSGESSRLRGPRGARNAARRTSGGANASISGSLNRSGAISPSGGAGLQRATNRLSYQSGPGSRSGSPNPTDYEPRKKGARTSAGAFGKRGMGSDPEE